MTRRMFFTARMHLPPEIRLPRLTPTIARITACPRPRPPLCRLKQMTPMTHYPVYTDGVMTYECKIQLLICLVTTDRVTFSRARQRQLCVYSLKSSKSSQKARALTPTKGITLPLTPCTIPIPQPADGANAQVRIESHPTAPQQRRPVPALH